VIKWSLNEGLLLGTQCDECVADMWFVGAGFKKDELRVEAEFHMILCVVFNGFSDILGYVDDLYSFDWQNGYEHLVTFVGCGKDMKFYACICL
jgi:hypothetical protein